MSPFLLFLLLTSLIPVCKAQNSPEAASIVDLQIEAWNKRDSQAFADTYSDSTKLFTFPNTLRTKFSSRQELMDYYQKFFTQNPKVFCEVKGKLVLGNTVVLHEYITGRSDGRIVQSLVTYKIKNGKIDEVYFDYLKKN